MHVVTRQLPTRQSLLSRLRDWNDSDSWQEFFDRYWKLIYNWAIKSGLSDAEAQDVVQETVLNVAKKMPDFKYRPDGSFKRWLYTCTQWRVADQLRARGRAPSTPGRSETDILNCIADPQHDQETEWDEEWNKNLVDSAIERVKRRVDLKVFQIYDLYVLKEWQVARIVATLKVSAMRVYLAKHRVGALMRQEIEYLQRNSL